ncbi:uncharacterized protein LOC135378232 isoform X2 [Ornithodoros turicata]|uniref:uncharacterized protein LOC135378232 isoform X2 n=1 Tax=Ornithodoros turicata TaxID=34597 RepID=UPI003139D475
MGNQPGVVKMDTHDGSGVPGQRKSAELWRDRNEVITLLEHRENLQIARDIVDDVVGQAVPVDSQMHADTAHSTEHSVAGPKTLSEVVPTEQKRTAVDMLDVLEQKVSDELNSMKRETETARSPIRLQGTDGLNSGSQVCSPQSERESFREILAEHAYSSPKGTDNTDERLPTEGESPAGSAAGFVDCVAEEDLPYLCSEVVTTSDENEVGSSIEASRSVMPHDVSGHAAMSSFLHISGEIVQSDVEQSPGFPHEMTLAHRNSDPSKTSPGQHVEGLGGITFCLEANTLEETRNVLDDVAAESVASVTGIQENIPSDPQGIRPVLPKQAFESDERCQELKCDYTTQSLENVPKSGGMHHLIATTELLIDEGSVTQRLQATDATDSYPMQTIMDDSLVAHRTFECVDAVTHLSGSLTEVTEGTHEISQTMPCNGPVEATRLVKSQKPKSDDTMLSAEPLRATVTIASNERLGIDTVEDIRESKLVLETLPEQTATATDKGFIFTDCVTHAEKTGTNRSSTPYIDIARHEANVGRRSSASENRSPRVCLQGMFWGNVTDDLNDLSIEYDSEDTTTSTLNSTVIERQPEETCCAEATLSSNEMWLREVSAAANDSICNLLGSGKIETSDIAVRMPEEQREVSVADTVLHKRPLSQSEALESIEGDGARFQHVGESCNDDAGVLSGTETSLAQARGLNDNTPPPGVPSKKTSVELPKDLSLPCSDLLGEAPSAHSGDEKESTSAAFQTKNEDTDSKFFEPTVISHSDVSSNQSGVGMANQELPEGDAIHALSQTPDKMIGDMTPITETVPHMDTTFTGDSGTPSAVGSSGAGISDTESGYAASEDRSVDAATEENPQVPGRKMQQACANEDVIASPPEAQLHDQTSRSSSPTDDTVYFDALNTSSLTLKSESSPTSASVSRSGGCVVHSHAAEDTALPFASVKSETHTYSQQGMDFAGVSVGGTTRLSGSKDSVLYDENVNPFVSQSVLPSVPIAPLEHSDSNDNIVVYNEGDGDRVDSTGYSGKPLDVKQLRPNRRSFTVRKDTPPQVSKPVAEVNQEDRRPASEIREGPVRELRGNRRSFTVRKDTPPEASHPASEERSEDKAPCQSREEPAREPRPNCCSSTVNAPLVQEAWEPLPEDCADLRTKTEAFSQNEDLPRDSEAGPEVAEFSEDEFHCAFEHFKDPSAFDFLQKFGDSKHLGRSSLGRCSLFLKFDPLLADGRPSLAPTIEVKEENSPASKSPAPHPNVPCAKSKSVELIDWSTSPKVEPSQDLCDTSVTAGSVQVKTEEQMFSEKEMSQALKFQELMFQERLLKKDQEQSEEHKEMQRRFEFQDNAIRNMFQAIKELVKTCDGAAKERQSLTADIAKLSKERDQLVEDLRGVEAAFSDFHRRYEQAKDIIRTMKENETLLRNQLTEAQTMLDKRNQMLSTLKTKAEESIETANKEIESSRKTMDAENTVLKAQMKKAEMKINSLEKHLEQKIEENSQLTQMYDDLLSKVQQN